MNSGHRKHQYYQHHPYLPEDNARKRQRRQTAGAFMQSLFFGSSSSGGSGSNSHRHSSHPVSTAQPRPVIFVPPCPMHRVRVLNNNDVLCGRGGRINSHPGNVQFRKLVALRKDLYLDKKTKKLEKAHIAADIVYHIRNLQGRFLKEDTDGSWYEIGDEKAIKKVGQALREDTSGTGTATDSCKVKSTKSLHTKEKTTKESASSTNIIRPDAKQTKSSWPMLKSKHAQRPHSTPPQQHSSPQHSQSQRQPQRPSVVVSGRGAKRISRYSRDPTPHTPYQPIVYQRIEPPPAYRQTLPPKESRAMQEDQSSFSNNRMASAGLVNPHELHDQARSSSGTMRHSSSKQPQKQRHPPAFLRQFRRGSAGSSSSEAAVAAMQQNAQAEELVHGEEAFGRTFHPAKSLQHPKEVLPPASALQPQSILTDSHLASAQEQTHLHQSTINQLKHWAVRYSSGHHNSQHPITVSASSPPQNHRQFDTQQPGRSVGNPPPVPITPAQQEFSEFPSSPTGQYTQHHQSHSPHHSQHEHEYPVLMERSVSEPPSPEQNNHEISFGATTTPPSLDRSLSLPVYSPRFPSSLLGDVDYSEDDAGHSPDSYRANVNLLAPPSISASATATSSLRYSAMGNGIAVAAASRSRTFSGGSATTPPHIGHAYQAAPGPYPRPYAMTASDRRASSELSNASNSESLPSVPGSIMSDLSESLVALDLAEPKV